MIAFVYSVFSFFLSFTVCLFFQSIFPSSILVYFLLFLFYVHLLRFLFSLFRVWLSMSLFIVYLFIYLPFILYYSSIFCFCFVDPRFCFLQITRSLLKVRATTPCTHPRVFIPRER